VTPKLQAELEQARTAAVAANLMVTELAVYLDELKEAADGWRRRNLIVDSLMERQEQVIRRLEAVAAAWEAQLTIITDLDRIDMQVKKLTGRMLQEAASSRKDPWESVS
jgi:hypothetical protein